MYNTQTDVMCGHYVLSAAHNISHMNDKTERNVGEWGILNQPRNFMVTSKQFTEDTWLKLLINNKDFWR